MSLTLDIPDEVMAELPVPEPERSRYVLLEVACALYARNVMSLGRAAEMVGMSKFDFGLEAGNRGILRHYEEADLSADIAYASGQ